MEALLPWILLIPGVVLPVWLLLPGVVLPAWLLLPEVVLPVWLPLLGVVLPLARDGVVLLARIDCRNWLLFVALLTRRRALVVLIVAPGSVGGAGRLCGAGVAPARGPAARSTVAVVELVAVSAVTYQYQSAYR